MRNHQAIDVAALRRREPHAVEQWFRTHADQVYTFVFFRVGKHPEIAADAVQETFLTALERIDRYDPDRGAMSVWLMYLARNCIRAANRLHQQNAGCQNTWDRIDARLASDLLDLSDQVDPLESLERRETVELVQMTLAQLPERYRWALVEHYHNARSLADLAHESATTESALKSVLHRARAAFRSAFAAITAEIGPARPAPWRTT
jgi:RNA polymerase sigma-70 factor (ECF subfamily)